MPVKSFLIRDLLSLNDSQSSVHQHQHGIADETLSSPGHETVIADDETCDALIFHWSDSNRLECLRSSEVPLPIYIRNDAKFVGSWPPKRRIRTIFTAGQISHLERRFQSQHYLTAGERAELARHLDLTVLQVKTWFQNRRMKWKKTDQLSQPTS